MKKMIILTAVAALFVGQLTLAGQAYAVTPQQQKMKDCNVQAKGKKGDERKAFMKECLSAKKGEIGAARSSQQEKMKNCNQEAAAKSLKGDERKAFMSSCLKG